MQLIPFRNIYNLYSRKRKKEAEEKQSALTSSVTKRTPIDAGVLPAMTVKVRRVNKAPKRPGSRDAGRGRTYSRMTISKE